MINQVEIPMYLEEALPELPKELIVSKKYNPYDAMNMLTVFTCKNIQEHNFKVVKRCFRIADKLFSRGNSTVQNAVQNVFVYSFTRIFQTYSEEKPQLLALLPITLYSLYITQIYNKGC